MEKLKYRLVRSDRKTISVQIMSDGEVVVRCPRRMRGAEVEKFLSEKRGWIEKHLSNRQPPLPKFTEAELRALTERAKAVLPERVAHFAGLLDVTYGRITVRTQRTRWGSCSGEGNLSFNCLLMLAPEEAADYVVVHELCHRKEMNHSARFWSEVERILPDYRERRRWLKENGQTLIGRLCKAKNAE